MKFDSDFIEKVRDANDIVDIIGQFTQLKPSGSNLNGLCPFPDHREKSPSFSVSQTKQVYYCFGCKKSGNIFTFLEQIQGLNFPDAVEYLANRAAIALPQETGSGFQPSGDKKKLQMKIAKFASEHFVKWLKDCPPDHSVRTYLKARGFSEDAVERFRIGYVSESWDQLTKIFMARKIPLDVAAELGLVKKSTKSQIGYFDIFRNRLIFPIFSVAGDVIGFGGRALGEDPPKYLNSSDSPIFHKGRLFYGLNESAKFIRAQDQAIVVEGYTDYLALYEAGIQNVVATLGTALTVDHARLLKRYTQNVVVLFDGDNAGQAAAERSAPILLSQGLFPRALILPQSQDPDEFLKANGPEKLKGLLLSAPELFSLLIQKYMKGFSGTQADRVRLLDILGPVLMASPDERLRDLYSHELAGWLNLPQKWVASALRKNVEGVPKQAPKTSQTVAPPVDVPSDLVTVEKAPRAEIELLNLALLRAEYLDEILASNIMSQFASKALVEIFNRIERIYRQMPSNFDKLTGLLTTQVKPSSTVSLHLDKPFVDISREGAKKLISDCSRKIRESDLRIKQKQITSHLRGLKATDQLGQLEQIMNIQRDRQALKNEPEPT